MKKAFVLIPIFCLFSAVGFAQQAPQVNAAELQQSDALAKSLITQQKARVTKAIANHKINLSGYLKTLDQVAKRDAVFAKLVTTLKSNKVTFAMDRGPEQRNNIVSSGFLNIHQTNSSAGAVRPEIRSFVESQYLGMAMADYDKLPNSVKPKSMYLVPLPETGIIAPPTHYYEGRGDTWVFAPEKISGNTMFVAGDSLDRALNESLIAEGGTPDFNFPMQQESLIDFVLPFDLLVTVAPYFYDQVKSENKWRLINVDSSKIQKVIEDTTDYEERSHLDLTSLALDESFFKTFPELSAYKEAFLFRPHGNYVEGLYYGYLDISKVSAFIYRQAPPTKDFADVLRTNGISIIDGR